MGRNEEKRVPETNRKARMLHHNTNQNHNATGDTADDSREMNNHGKKPTLYHRPPTICIMPGEMLLGGLAMRMPFGFTIGIALLPDRMAEGA